MTGDDDYSVHGQDGLIVNGISIFLPQDLAQSVVRFGENNHVWRMSKIALQGHPVCVRASEQGHEAKDATVLPGMCPNVGPQLLLRPRTDFSVSDKAGSY